MLHPRSPRTRSPRAGTWLVTLGGLVALLAASPTGHTAPGGPASPGDGPTERYALVVSGGVSLGAYEAGLLWALTKLLEQGGASVVGVSGASAGAINGLLTSLAVCSDRGAPERGLVNPFRAADLPQNPFYDSWMSVGVGDLLPSEAREADGRREGATDEGVLARDRVDALFGRLRSLLDTAGIWRADCDLPFAVTVTCAVPTVRTEAGIPAPVQRFAIPLKLVASTAGKVTRLAFANHVEVLGHAREAGEVLFLAERVDYANGVHPQDVLDAVRASSSFPLAFGPTELTYCAPAAECPDDLPSPAERQRLERRNAGYTCRDVYDRLAASGQSPWRVPGQAADPFLEPCTSRFVDGGVFDNTPLGLAIAQSETAPGEPVTYLYVDPDLRRHGPEATLKPNVGRRGVRRVGAVLSEVVSTARGQALHEALRHVRFNASLSPLLDAAARSLAQAREVLQSPDSLTLRRLEANGVKTRERLAIAEELRQARERLDAIERSLATSEGAAWRAALRAFVDWGSPLLERTFPRLTQPAPYAPLQEPLELASTLEEDPREARRLVALRRYPPLAASQLGNFGAFLDAPFREHDFAAGVYDAAQGFATADRHADPRLDDSEKTRRALAVLGLGRAEAGSPAAVVDTLVNDLARLEWEPGDDAQATACGQGGTARVRSACAVARSLRSQRAECEQVADTSPCFDDPPFAHFLEQLRENAYQPDSDDMRAMLEHRQWWAVLTARALLRLSEIEADELAAIRADATSTADQPDAVRRANEGALEAQAALASAVNQGAYWLRAYANVRNAFEADPSTVPDDGRGLWAWHLVPFWLEVDPVRAGVGVGYEPGLSWGWAELRLRLAAARYWADDHVTPWLVRQTLANHATLLPCSAGFACDRVHHASSAAGLALAFPDLGTRMLSLGLGVEADVGWLNRLVQLGGSVYVGTLLDRVRVRVGARVAEWDLERGGGPYLRRGAWLWDLRLELADLNGILWEWAR